MHPIAHLARRLVSDDPARTSPLVTPASAYSHWAAWPSAPDLNRVALGVHTCTTPLPDRHARWEPGPTHIHRAGTRPCAWPALPHLHPSCAAAPHSTAGTIRHPGSSQHLSAQRHRSTLLCTAHLSGHLMHLRIISLHLSGCALQLPVLGVAPNCGSTHSPKVTSFVIECLPERPLLCSAAQAGCGCSTTGWRSSVPAREDVRSG